MWCLLGVCNIIYKTIIIYRKYKAQRLKFYFIIYLCYRDLYFLSWVVSSYVVKTQLLGYLQRVLTIICCLSVLWYQIEEEEEDEALEDEDTEEIGDEGDGDDDISAPADGDAPVPIDEQESSYNADDEQVSISESMKY